MNIIFFVVGDKKAKKRRKKFILCSVSHWRNLSKAVVQVGPWCQKYGMIVIIINFVRYFWILKEKEMIRILYYIYIYFFFSFFHRCYDRWPSAGPDAT